MQVQFLINVDLKEVPVKELMDSFARNYFRGDIIGLNVSRLNNMYWVTPIRETPTPQQVEEERLFHLEGWHKHYGNAESPLRVSRPHEFRYAIWDNAVAIFRDKPEAEINAYKDKLVDALSQLNLVIIYKGSS